MIAPRQRNRLKVTIELLKQRLHQPWVVSAATKEMDDEGQAMYI